MRTTIPSLVLVLLAPAVGWAQHIDVSHHAIACSTMLASVQITPPLAVGGTAAAVAMRVKGTVAGCAVTGPGLDPVTIRSGKVRGKVVGTSNECITAAAPLAGTLTIRWKADKTTPILQTSSTLTVTNVTFTLFGAPWGATYGLFSLGTGGVTGAFTGGDGGVTSSNAAITNQDLGEILTQCGSSAGLGTLDVGLGQVTLR